MPRRHRSQPAREPRPALVAYALCAALSSCAPRAAPVPAGPPPGTRGTPPRLTSRPTPFVTWRWGTIPAPEGSRGVRALDGSTRGEAQGSLVYCGYGLVDPASGRDDFAGRALRGRLALIVDRAPPELERSLPAQRLRSSTKILEARRRGAVGVILMPRGRGRVVSSRTGLPPGSAGVPCVAVDWELALDLFGVWGLSFELHVGELDLDIGPDDPLPGDGSWRESDVLIGA